MSGAFRCAVECDQPTAWRLDRRGDAAVTWACDLDLVDVLTEFQRPGERTEIVVTQASTSAIERGTS